MKIMITNDDGYFAPGLRALYGAASQHGEVTVVAPLVCHSCKAHAVSTDKEAIVTYRKAVDGLGEVWIVEGTPADCSQVGLTELLDETPDMVMSGINGGANLGVDVYYSGTVAAAREAAILGRPAIAVSQFHKKGLEVDWEWTERLAGAVLGRLLALPTPAGCLWNVNLPAVERGQLPASLTFVPTSVDQQDIRYRVEEGRADGSRAYRYAGSFTSRPVREQTDVDLVFSGHAVATLLQIQTAVDSRPPRQEPFPEIAGP